MGKNAESSRKTEKPKRACTCGGDMLWSKTMPGNKFCWYCTKCSKRMNRDGVEKK